MKHKDYTELKAQLSSLASNAEHGRSEKEERFRKSFLYFSCLAPEKRNNEMSSYVEPVVRRAVEAVKPSLMNIFTENEKKAVSFRPLTRSKIGVDVVASGAGVSIASVIDDYINKVFINENRGYEILDRAISEVLITGDVFLKYFVEEERIEETITLEKVPEEMLNVILNDYPDTDIDKMKKAMSKRNGLMTGTFTALKIERPIRIEYVPFADIFINGAYEDIGDARYVCQRMSKTVGEMIEMGFDKEKLMSASEMRSGGSYGNLSTQKLVNLGSFGEEDTVDQCFDPMERSITIYEHYLYSSLVNKNSDKVKLYRVLSTENEILDVEEAVRIPFVHGCMERIPGSFWGVSLYDKFGPIQEMVSRLIRAVEFNAADGAYGRYIAIEGGFNRQSLLNNRPGSVIEVSESVGVGGVQRFPKEDLPPSLDALISRMTNSTQQDLMSSVGVDVSGANISATAAAITANSADLKDKVIARTLAYTLFRPLFEGLYDIIVGEDLVIGEIDNPQVAQAQEMGLGEDVIAQIPAKLPIRGSELPSSADFIIDVNTANDDAMLNSQIMNLITLFAQIPPGLVNTQEIAAQLTGLSEEEVLRFFPEAPGPTEEQQMMEQAQMEVQLETSRLSIEMMKGEMAKTAIETVKKEREVLEMIADSEAKRMRDQEKSLQEFKKLELKEKEMTYEMETGEKIQISDI